MEECALGAESGLRVCYGVWGAVCEGVGCMKELAYVVYVYIGTCENKRGGCICLCVSVHVCLYLGTYTCA